MTEEARQARYCLVSEELAGINRVQFEKTEGDTPLTDLKCLHVDVVSLDLSRIEQLSRLLADAIRKDENHRRFTNTDILELLCRAVGEGRLSLNDLRDEQEKLREAVKNHLAP